MRIMSSELDTYLSRGPLKLSLGALSEINGISVPIYTYKVYLGTEIS